MTANTLKITTKSLLCVQSRTPGHGMVSPHPQSNLPESTVTGMPEIRFLGCCKSHKFTVMTSHLFLFAEKLWKTRAGSVCENPRNVNVSWCERSVCCFLSSLDLHFT